MSSGDPVDPQPVPARPAPRPPWIVWLGLAVVLAAAAALSFDALRALAVAVGIPRHFAWLLPVAVDAGAAVSCATWLGGRTTPDAARFAGRMTWSLLGVTVLGNAGQLGMHAYGVTPPWWVAALVGAIPPAIVGSTVHLIVLLVRRSETTETAVRTTETAQAEREIQDDTEAWVDPWDRWADQEAETTGPGADQERTTPDPLLDEAVRWARSLVGPPSQRAVRARFGIGAERAKSLHEAITTGRTTAPATGH